MRWLISLVCFLCLAAPGRAGDAVSGRVLKVLPLLMDLKGRTQTSPSLYERDAFQAMLRGHPAMQSGIEFAVEVKVSGPKETKLTMRIEARGGLKGQFPTQVVLEKSVTPTGMFSSWTSIKLTGDDFKKFGEVSAWRVSLWDGSRKVHEEKSFLWEGELKDFAPATNAAPRSTTTQPAK